MVALPSHNRMYLSRYNHLSPQTVIYIMGLAYKELLILSFNKLIGKNKILIQSLYYKEQIYSHFESIYPFSTFKC